VDWVAVPVGEVPDARVVTVGAGVPDGLDAQAAYPDLAALIAAVAAGESAPDLVVTAFEPAAEQTADAARRAATDALALVQQWLAADELVAARLVIVTRGAVSTGAGEGVGDPAGATIWGLMRTAQSENPDRLVLVDLPDVPGAQ